jgi:RHS repeat-associated protein
MRSKRGKGQVVGVTNGSGTLEDVVTYDVYGNITNETNSSWGGAYKYAGMEFDTTTALYFSRARYYDATTGRWISQDLMGFKAGDSNLYRYVNNDPTIATDPSGLDVRIESTNSPVWFHLRITVDVWDDDGQLTGTYSISFGVDGNRNGWCSSGSNSSGGGSSGSSGGGSSGGTVGPSGSGSSSTNGSGGGPASGNNGTGSGIVYVDKGMERGASDTLKTTPGQDKNIQTYLESLVGNRGNYNFIIYNCRTFSRQQFELIKRQVGAGLYGQ